MYKLSATGNDFILVDLLPGDRQDSPVAKALRSQLTKELCNRNFGVGADGCIFIDPDSEADFQWDFYNSDGSPAEMCGNAARAVGLWAQPKFAKSQITFRTVVGMVRATVQSSQQITVELPEIKEFAWDQTTLTGQSYHFVNSGVPHAVVFVQSLNSRNDLREIASQIKSDPRFLAQGINVTFVVTQAKNVLESVTLERGVEDFTLSCGTGAIASAFASLRGKTDIEVKIKVPGGNLSVNWQDRKPLLTGPAKTLAQFTWLGSQIL